MGGGVHRVASLWVLWGASSLFTLCRVQDQPNAREQELEAELRRVQTDMELIKRELHKLQEGQTAQKSSKCCCVIM